MREEPGLNVRRGVAALALGHGVNDLYMGFLPALLPALVLRLHLDYAQAGLLVTYVTLWSHVAQPLIGYGADRVGRRHLVVLGPLITTLAMSSLGLVGSYRGLVMALTLGSLGNALFHPLAASLTGTISRASRAAMALFSAGGSLGYGLGSLLIAEVVVLFGLERMWTMAGFGLVTVGFMYAALPRAVEATRTPVVAGPEGERLHWVAPLLVLFVVVALRAAEGTVLTTFVPLLLSARGEGLEVGGWAILAYSVACAAGGMAGGPLSLRFGAKWVTVLSLALSVPAIVLFLLTRGPWAWGLLLLVGAFLFAALPLNIIMAQELLPRHASTASGIIMGLAWGVGSFSAKVVGAHADRLASSLGAAMGLQRVLEYSALLVLAGAVMAMFLPGKRGGGGGVGAARAKGTDGESRSRNGHTAESRESRVERNGRTAGYGVWGVGYRG